jgi:hypothetical protein
MLSKYCLVHLHKHGLKNMSIKQSLERETIVAKLVNRIIFSGKLSRQDHVLLTSKILGNSHISDGERRQINRVFDQVQTGQLKLIGW